jgi:hypothetical protein
LDLSIPVLSLQSGMTPPPGGSNGHHHRRQQVSAMESGGDAPGAAARRRFNWKAPAIVLGNSGACAAVLSILIQIRTPSIPESGMGCR